MAKKNDRDMPEGALKRIEDFLPSPEKLSAVDSTVKVTITLNQSSIDFFKRMAEKNHTKYQKMIREILDRYATHYRAA